MRNFLILLLMFVFSWGYPQSLNELRKQDILKKEYFQKLREFFFTVGSNHTHPNRPPRKNAVRNFIKDINHTPKQTVNSLINVITSPLDRHKLSDQQMVELVLSSKLDYSLLASFFKPHFNRVHNRANNWDEWIQAIHRIQHAAKKHHYTLESQGMRLNEAATQRMLYILELFKQMNW